MSVWTVEHYWLDHQFVAQRKDRQNRWLGMDTCVVCIFPCILYSNKYEDDDTFPMGRKLWDSKLSNEPEFWLENSIVLLFDMLLAPMVFYYCDILMLVSWNLSKMPIFIQFLLDEASVVSRMWIESKVMIVNTFHAPHCSYSHLIVRRYIFTFACQVWMVLG